MARTTIAKLKESSSYHVKSEKTFDSKNRAINYLVADKYSRTRDGDEFWAKANSNQEATLVKKGSMYVVTERLRL